jgi:peptidoglycan/LPS O-acetylase OafA/YrhL
VHAKPFPNPDPNSRIESRIRNGSARSNLWVRPSNTIRAVKGKTNVRIMTRRDDHKITEHSVLPGLGPLLRENRTHVPELDGVRGLAILAVMVYHFGQCYPSSPHNLLATAISLGWSGVDLFFVLSGFLITTILIGTKSDPHFFRSFYIRRGLRILPLYYAYIFLFAFVFLPVAHHFHRFGRFHVGQLSLYWVHLSNWSSALGPLADSPVGQMWSLAIEEQFYFFWPLLIFLLPEEILLILCLALSVTAIGLRLVPAMQAIQLGHTGFFYRLTPFRIEPICYGAIIALLSRKRRTIDFRGWAGWVCLVSGLALVCRQGLLGHTFDSYTLAMATLGYTAVGLCSAGILFLALRYAGTNGLYARLLRTNLLRTFGKYSYAMYIFQIPIAEYSYRLVFRITGHPLIRLALNYLLGISVTLILAKLSWECLESPVLGLKDRIAGYRKEVNFDAVLSQDARR